jgi:hypothetical protein
LIATVTNARAAPAKRFLDIEVALRWAFRDELPKRQHGGRYDSRRLDGGMLVSAEHVQANAQDEEDRSRDPGFPAAMGDPHPDSIDIEKAVNRLGDWAGYRFGADRMAALTSDLPLAIDPGLVAIEAIAAMSGTVTINARMATRPKWSSETPTSRWTTGKNGVPQVLVDETFVQVIDRRGRVFYEPARGPLPPDAVFYRAAIACPHTRKDLYREGAYCPILWRPDPVRLLTERAEHCAWHAALEILAAELEGQLVAIAVLSPAAAWAPWLRSHDPSARAQDAQDIHGQPPTLFAGLREAPYRVETREQAAARRRTAQRRMLHEAQDARTRLAGQGARGVPCRY